MKELTIWIDPGDAPKEVIQELFEALGNYQRACGGLGIEFSEDIMDIEDY